MGGKTPPTALAHAMGALPGCEKCAGPESATVGALGVPEAWRYHPVIEHSYGTWPLIVDFPPSKKWSFSIVMLNYHRYQAQRGLKSGIKCRHDGIYIEFILGRNMYKSYVGE